MNIETCTMCGEGGHTQRKCPELRTPLKEGFQKGEGGGGGHSHDDDECCENCEEVHEDKPDI